MPLTRPLYLAFFGETGVGKSSALNSMICPDTAARKLDDGCAPHEAWAPVAAEDKDTYGADDVGGCTKTPRAYVGREIDGRKVMLLDFPGFGDANVNMVQIVENITSELDHPIDGCLFFQPTTDHSVRSGAAFMRDLVKTGFAKTDAQGDIWGSMIFVGTFGDEASAKAIKKFNEAHVPAFFKAREGVFKGKGLSAVIGRVDPEEHLGNGTPRIDTSKIEAAVQELSGTLSWTLTVAGFQQVLKDRSGLDEKTIEQMVEKYKEKEDEIIELRKLAATKQALADEAVIATDELLEANAYRNELDKLSLKELKIKADEEEMRPKAKRGRLAWRKWAPDSAKKNEVVLKMVDHKFKGYANDLDADGKERLLPPGWIKEVRQGATKTYPVYRGPNDEYAETRKKAWEGGNKNADGTVKYHTKRKSAPAAESSAAANE